MTAESNAADFQASLEVLATPEQRQKYTRYFPNDDSFIGVRMGDVRRHDRIDTWDLVDLGAAYLGDVDRDALIGFLDENATVLARTALRSATEKLDRPVRAGYLAAARHR